MGPPLAHRRRPGAGPFSFFLPLLGGRPLRLELGIHWPPWGTTTPPTTRPEPFSKLRSTGRDVPPGTLLCLPCRPHLGSFFGARGLDSLGPPFLGSGTVALGFFHGETGTLWVPLRVHRVVGHYPMPSGPIRSVPPQWGLGLSFW